MKVEYQNENSEIGKWLRHTFGLCFLSPEDVSDCFVFDFQSDQPTHAAVTKYCDYLIENYISDEAVFPPSMWALKSSSLALTTNACESFHAHYNSQFNSAHPNIFYFFRSYKKCSD